MRLWKFALPVVVLATVVTPAQGVSEQTVSYRGYQVTVPASWPVVDLAKDPTACVRYDRPAVYLGASTAQANCPAHLAGRSEGIVLEPLTKAARSTDGELQVAAQDAGVLATAYYAPGGEQAARKVLGTGQVTSKSFRTAVTPKVAAASIVATGALTGLAFDTCAAPSQTAMNAWAGSAYKAVGIYISGGLRACGQPNLTQDWVVANAANNWQFLLIDVGMQAPCTTYKSKMSADPATARNQGRTAAAGAITAATALGFTQRSRDLQRHRDLRQPDRHLQGGSAVLPERLDDRAEQPRLGVRRVRRRCLRWRRPEQRLQQHRLQPAGQHLVRPLEQRCRHQRRRHRSTSRAPTGPTPSGCTSTQVNQSETINGVTMSIDRNAVKLTPPPAALTAFTGTGASGSAALRWTVPAGTTLGQVVVRRNTGATPPGLPGRRYCGLRGNSSFHDGHRPRQRHQLRVPRLGEGQHWQVRPWSRLAASPAPAPRSRPALRRSSGTPRPPSTAG